MPIETRQDLIEHLQTALLLEHSTIPPYLCALYSMEEGRNVHASTVIRSVVMEEMLHMTLVANLLNAIGGEPIVDDPELVPRYPGFLPHSDEEYTVDLLPFSTDALELFRKIECPPAKGAAPQADRYHTIGQFYEAIRTGIDRLAKRDRHLFDGDPARQVTPERWYYGGGGLAIVVNDLDSARRAINEIIEQGEGATGELWDADRIDGGRDLAHFYKFNELFIGRCYLPTDTVASGPTGAEIPIDWSAVHPMRPNPRVADFAGQPELQALMVEFNRVYTRLLGVLHAAFNGAPGVLLDAVPLMYDLKYRGQALMKIPSGKGDGQNAGPSFEYTR